MEFTTYLFDLIVFALIGYAFCRDRAGLSAMLIRAPWDYLNADFRKWFDIECQAEAKRILRKHRSDKYSGTMNLTIFFTLLIVLITSYLSIQLCHWPMAVAMIIYHLYRLPLNMAAAFAIKRYLENPKAIANVA